MHHRMHPLLLSRLKVGDGVQLFKHCHHNNHQDQHHLFNDRRMKVRRGANNVCVTQLKNETKKEKYSHLQMYFGQNGVQNTKPKAAPEKCTCIENQYVLPSNQPIYTTLSQTQ